jgi:hypothetical protein
MGANCLPPSCFPWRRHNEFERRRILYAHLDRDLHSKTRFFAAAELVNEVFANLFGWLPAEVFATSFAFLNELGASLESINLRHAGAIRHGRLTGHSLDHSLVRLEQREVQLRWHRWSTRSGDVWGLQRELNGILNDRHPVALLAPFMPGGRVWSFVIAAVRRGLGVDLDFADESHRVQIGCALIRQLRSGGSRIAITPEAANERKIKAQNI